MIWQILIYGFLAFIGASILGRMFTHDHVGTPIGAARTFVGTLAAIGTGVSTGLAVCIPRVTESPVWGLMFFVAMMALLVVSVAWFGICARRILELIPFAILATAIIMAAQAAVHVMALWWESPVLSWVFFVIPWSVFAVLLGIAGVVVCARLFASTFAAVWRVLGVILVLAGLIAGFIVIPVNGNAIAGIGTSTAELTEATATNFWCTFYNNECQKNDDPKDDLNFGLNPYKKGMSAQELAKKHRDVMLTDPANGTTAMCWLDKHVGTRYMGDKFYSEYAGHDDTAINAAKEVYINDESLYKKTMTVFFSYLSRAAVEIREIQEGSLKDQMYMIPSSDSFRGVPDVAAFEGGEQGGHYLVYIFTIKGKVVEVPFRVECLFQPTNVTEYLKVTVTPKPTPEEISTRGTNPSPGGTDPYTPPETTEPKGTGSPDPSKPTSPTNPYNKDPSKSDNSGKNDDSGSGKNTNNGDGANYSTEDNDSNSNHTTWEEYQKSIEELKDTNSSQNTPKNNNPSYNGGGTVDNNGAAANTPSPNKPKESAISGDSNGQEWDGPDI